MSLNFLTDLTEEADHSFSGASQKDFTKRWSLSRSHEITSASPDETYTIALSGDEATLSISISPSLISDHSFKRLASHILVELIANSGLDETLETLKELYEFYATRSENPEIPSQTQATGFTGRVTHTYVRPEFPIPFDEE